MNILRVDSGVVRDVTAKLRRHQIWVIFGGLMLGSFLGSLDQTVVATALPTIVRDLGTASQLSWIVTAYLLTSTVAIGLWGKLSDILGRRPVYLVCTAIFLVGSALAGFSQSILELILFRALQGVGGGGLQVLPKLLSATSFRHASEGATRGCSALSLACPASLARKWVASS